MILMLSTHEWFNSKRLIATTAYALPALWSHLLDCHLGETVVIFWHAPSMRWHYVCTAYCLQFYLSHSSTLTKKWLQIWRLNFLPHNSPPSRLCHHLPTWATLTGLMRMEKQSATMSTSTRTVTQRVRASAGEALIKFRMLLVELFWTFPRLQMISEYLRVRFSWPFEQPPLTELSRITRRVLPGFARMSFFVLLLRLCFNLCVSGDYIHLAPDSP
jgi:hypothetical protein